ncbi:unnamed protein product, partial [Durusdinium trenchii]
TLGSSAFSRLYSIYPSRSFVCAPPWTTFAVITAPFATKTSVAKICGVWRSMYGPSTTRANLRRTSTRTTIVTILQLLRAVNPPRVLPFLSVLSALLMLIAAVMPLQVLPASDRQRVPRRTVAVAAKTAVLQAATARQLCHHHASPHTRTHTDTDTHPCQDRAAPRRRSPTPEAGRRPDIPSDLRRRKLQGNLHKLFKVLSDFHKP